MNKYSYISGLVLLQLFNIVTSVEAVDLKYVTNNSLDLRQDEDVGWENLKLINPTDKLTITDSLNLAENENFSLISFGNNLTLLPPENSLCAIVYKVRDEQRENNASVRFLPQVEGSKIFKGVFDYDQNEVCQVNNENQIISRFIEVKETENNTLENDLTNFEKISLIDYTAKIQQFTPPKINYQYLQTAQNINNLISFTRPTSTYQSNIQSLSLINSMAIKPITIVTNNNSVVSNKPVFSQPTNTQSNLNYLNAIAAQETRTNFNNVPVKSSQSQIPVSPILQKLNQEREKQAEQTRKQQEQLKQRIQQQIEQQRKREQQLAEQRRKQREQELKKRQQQLQKR